MKKMKRREFLKTAGLVAVGVRCVTGGMSGIHAQEKPNLANKGDEFTPGEKVKTSGIYDVIHDKIDGDDHAQQHQVTATAGTVFPRCKGCREWVRFRLYRAAARVEADSHLES